MTDAAGNTLCTGCGVGLLLDGRPLCRACQAMQDYWWAELDRRTATEGEPQDGDDPPPIGF